MKGINRGGGRRSATATKARKVAPLFDKLAPPSHLTPEQAGIWTEAAGILSARRELTLGDLPDLELYASELAVLRQLDRKLAGVEIMGENGKPHPLVSPRRCAATAVYRLSTRLGLNPKATRADKVIDPHAEDATDTTTDF